MVTYYYLPCGQCGVLNYMTSTFASTAWVCPSCGNTNTTSVPVGAGRAVLSTPGAAKSVVVAPNAITHVVQGTDATLVVQPSPIPDPLPDPSVS